MFICLLCLSTIKDDQSLKRSCLAIIGIEDGVSNAGKNGKHCSSRSFTYVPPLGFRRSSALYGKVVVSCMCSFKPCKVN